MCIRRRTRTSIEGHRVAGVGVRTRVCAQGRAGVFARWRRRCAVGTGAVTAEEGRTIAATAGGDQQGEEKQEERSEEAKRSSASVPRPLLGALEPNPEAKLLETCLRP